MKFFGAIVVVCFTNYASAQSKFNDTTLLQPVEVKAVKASETNPFAKINLSKQAIEKLNIGQDLPFILSNTVSVVANSDAGNGVGYTGIRIRGTDAARINVTLNGIPYNDAESQGTFFVNMPDIAASAGSIQVQRGVGTSANGAGSFGGSINVSTNEIERNKNLSIGLNAGSFGTLRSNIKYNSGIFKNNFLVDARVSFIRSDGYIDRASSNLKSAYVSVARVTSNSSLRFNTILGKEKTYQAYYGVSESLLQTNRTFNQAGTEKVGDPYSNQVDNYNQNHFQLFYNKKINTNWKLNVATFLTLGKGYFEQYKADEKLRNYGLPSLGTITNSDLVRQLWLDNNFYGLIFSLPFEKNKTQLNFGGAANVYNGDHFGRVTWLAISLPLPNNFKYYNLEAVKKDFSAYTKWTQTITNKLETFIDLQVRNVVYNINGFRNNPGLFVKNNYTFLNPKAGITYTNKNYKFFASYARAAKEPNRDDFEASTSEIPVPEILNDIEIGFERKNKTTLVGTNFYYMFYKNQLVLNGKINDVGAATRVNIKNSFRTGLELYAIHAINKNLTINANTTLSQNKVKNYTDFVYNYDTDKQEASLYKKADIAYSPNVMATVQTSYKFYKNATIDFISKYVGKQFLDNTSNQSKILNAFFTQDIRLNYLYKIKKGGEVNSFVQVNNVLNNLYEPNGYTFSYISGGAKTTENYFFPMAGVNLNVGVSIKFW
jgi:iron complex outermembrane recepter protein